MADRIWCRHTFGTRLITILFTVSIMLLAEKPARAQNTGTCDQSIGTAFARVSPLETYSKQDDDANVNVAATFAEPLSVIRVAGRRALICLDGRPLWVRRTQIAQVGFAEWVTLPDDLQSVRRPQVKFWRSQERLGAFLTGSNIDEARADYLEHALSSSDATTPARFPVLRRDFLESGIGSTALEVASVLVAFTHESVALYQATHAEGGTTDPPPEVPMALVVDVSGSTEGFTDAYARDFLEAAEKSGKLPSSPIIVVPFGGDGTVGPVTTRNIEQLKTASWPVRAASFGSSGQHALADAIRAATETITGPDKELDVIVMAGGDVAVSKPRDGVRLLVGKTTPELQDTLYKSSVTAGALFADFYDGGAKSLVTFLSERVTTPERAALKREDFAPVAKALSESGFFPVLPGSFEEETNLIAIPAAAQDASWFAVPLWTIVNGVPLVFE